jgi:anti-sigma factor RsiW
MSDCSSLDALLTPYVEGDLPAGDRVAVERHLLACAHCRSRVGRERAIRDVLHDRRTELRRTVAPDRLRARCAAALSGSEQPTPRHVATSPGRGGWWPASRTVRLAVAAMLLVGIGTVGLSRIVQTPSRVVAAELAADHVKCFMMNAVLGTHQSVEAAEELLANGFGWDAQLSARPEAAGLELVGARPCLYDKGRIAHVMFRHEGRPVSLFMLPKDRRTDEVLETVGHAAAIWSVGDRTFVLVARESSDEVQRMASLVHATFR